MSVICEVSAFFLSATAASLSQRGVYAHSFSRAFFTRSHSATLAQSRRMCSRTRLFMYELSGVEPNIVHFPNHTVVARGATDGQRRCRNILYIHMRSCMHMYMCTRKAVELVSRASERTGGGDVHGVGTINTAAATRRDDGGGGAAQYHHTHSSHSIEATVDHSSHLFCDLAVSSCWCAVLVKRVGVRVCVLRLSDVLSAYAACALCLHAALSRCRVACECVWCALVV